MLYRGKCGPLRVGVKHTTMPFNTLLMKSTGENYF